MKARALSALALGVAVTVSAAAAVAADALGDFAMSALIELQGKGPYYQLSLPFAAHWSAHSPDMRDLRVFNAQGQAVPFAVLRATPSSEQVTEDTVVPWFPLYASDATSGSPPDIRVERRADGTVVSVSGGENRGDGAPKLRGYLLDLSQVKHPARRLTLDWDSAVTGFQHLSVEASDDLVRWRSWDDDVALARVDFNGQHVERRKIELGDRRAGYLRLMWSASSTAPTLTAATVTTTTASDHPAPLAWSDTLAPTRMKEGEYEWQLPEPVAAERLRIGVAETNVLAPAELWDKDDLDTKTPWRFVGRTVLYRLAAEGHDRDQGDIPIAQRPFRLFKLTLDTGRGDIGHGAPTLALGLTTRQVLFLAQGDAPFVLALGSDTAKQAALVPATLVPGYDTKDAPPISPATLGPIARIAPSLATPPEPVLAVTWKTLTLWAILLVGIAAIAAMALYLLRQIRR